MSATGYFDTFDRQKLDPRDRDGFRSAMIAFCRSNKVAAEALLAGNVQMLGLENLKDQFGANWTKVRGKVHLLTETVIKKTITANDVYVLANAEQFIVLFGTADRRTAERKARHIADEVNKRLHGAGAAAGLNGISVKSLVLELPRDEPEKLSGVKELTQSVEEARAERQREETAAFEKVKETIRLQYWPITNVRKRLVSMYRAELAIPANMLPDTGSETGALECAIDIAAIQRAAAAMRENRRAKALLLLPVHMETLTVKQFREAYIAECKALPEWAERRMFLYVQGIDDDVPQTKLHNNFNYLAPFCAGFVGGFSRTFSRAGQLSGARMIGVGCSGADISALNAQTVGQMSDFVVKNHGEGRRTFFFGARDLDAATTARKVHYDYVDGPGAVPAIASFGKVLRVA